MRKLEMVKCYIGISSFYFSARFSHLPPALLDTPIRKYQIILADI
jgi:hypothetical protein